MLRRTVLLLASALILTAQNRVPEQFRYERIMAIVPMVGTGTEQDPFRPMFAPTAEDVASGDAKFLSVSYEISDDGKTAIVEFVARDKKAFEGLLEASQGRDVQVFRPGRETKEDLEREVRKFKPDYNFTASRSMGRDQ